MMNDDALRFTFYGSRFSVLGSMVFGGTSMSEQPSNARPKVLVTGASGLIGRLTIEHLGHKYEFSGLSRRPVAGIPHTQADIVDLAALRHACQGMDMVLHLAAETQNYD